VFYLSVAAQISLRVQIAAAWPLFFTGLSANCRGCAQADRGGEGHITGWGHDHESHPPLAPVQTSLTVVPLRD